MNRREVLEHLVHVWGVRDLNRLRRLTREYLAYQGRRRGREGIGFRRSAKG